MTDLNNLLDKIKETRSIASDNALAAAIGVSRQRVSAWRHGTNLPDPVACATIAGLSGEPLARVLGIVGEARAISREEKAVWHKLATSVAAVILLAVAIPLPARDARSPQDRAQAQETPYFAESGRGMHIMSAGRGVLTLIGDVLLWLRWKFSGKIAGPHLEAMTA